MKLTGTRHCAWPYAFFPMGVHLRFMMCTRDWRCTVFEAGRLRKIYYQHGWRQEHCSFFILVSNCWPLTITALSLMTSSGSYYLLGDEPCQQTFSQVSGYRFSSSFFVFSLVLWHSLKADGENKRPTQCICPQAFISIMIILNEVAKVQAQINFPPDR